MKNKYANFFQLKGLVLYSLAYVDDSECHIKTDVGEFHLRHSQYCGGHVRLFREVGDATSLLGEVILDAYEDDKEPEEVDAGSLTDSSRTWSHYVIKTAKGTYEMYFLGESNGYYSETMSFVEVVR